MAEESIPCLLAKIAALRASRDEWMDRSNSHAMEADRYRVDAINLKGQMWQMELDIKSKDILLECVREELVKAEKPQPTLTDEEREAIKQAIHIVDWQQAYFSHAGLGQPLPSATLRSLLERTKCTT